MTLAKTFRDHSLKAVFKIALRKTLYTADILNIFDAMHDGDMIISRSDEAILEQESSL